MNFYSVLVWVGAGIVVLISLVMMITGRPIWMNEKKYTYDSLESFSRVGGAMGVVIGISAGIVLYNLAQSTVNTMSMVSLIVLCITYVSYYVCKNYVCKKKMLILKGTKLKKKKK